MPDSYTYTFGCAAVEGKAGWLVQNSDENDEAQEALALDNVGEPVKAHYYQRINGLNFVALIPAEESSVPEVGDVFTYDGTKYYVATVAKAKVNTDFVRYTLTCKHFVAHNLPT